jgi:RNA polymerase sigma-54 factor
VKDRVVRLPDGTLTAFAALFGPGNDIRMALHALMATEPRCSDQRLADLLAAQGIVIARRTVAKYRSESGVPVTARRRGLAGSAAT